MFPVSDWKDLKREADENGEYFKNYLRDAMWDEMCMFCADLLKCRFKSVFLIRPLTCTVLVRIKS